MTKKEKLNYLDRYINDHYGEEFAEWLLEMTNHCTNDRQLVAIADKYLLAFGPC